MIFYHAVKWLALLSIAQAGEKAFRGYGLAGKGENKASVDPRLLLAQEGVGWKKAAGGCVKVGFKFSGQILKKKQYPPEEKQVTKRNFAECREFARMQKAEKFSLEVKLPKLRVICSLYNSEAIVVNAEKDQMIVSWMRQCANVSCHPQSWARTRVLESTCRKCPSSLKTIYGKKYDDEFLCNNESCQFNDAKKECVAREKIFDEWIPGECAPRLRANEWQKVKARGNMSKTDCSNKCGEKNNVTACKFRHGKCYWTDSKKPTFVLSSKRQEWCRILSLKESLSRPKREIPIPVQVVKARTTTTTTTTTTGTPPACLSPDPGTRLAYKIREVNLNMGGSFKVKVECSHRGKAVEKDTKAQAIVCESANTPYIVTGCQDMGFPPPQWWCRKKNLNEIKKRLTDMSKPEKISKRLICKLGNKLIIGRDNSVLKPGEKYLSGLFEIGNRKADFQSACSVSEDRGSPDQVELSTLLDKWLDEEAKEFYAIGKIIRSDEVNDKCDNLYKDWLNFNREVYGKIKACDTYTGGCEEMLANLKLNPYLKKEETNSEGNPVEEEETDSEEANTEGS